MSALVSARFVERPNRFVVQARLNSGQLVSAHLADPGRLKDLLVAGAALRLRPAGGSKPRATTHSAVLVRTGTTWVSLETTQANRLGRQLLERGAIRGIPRGRIQAEVTVDGARLDFAIEPERGPRCWVEVKSVTHVDAGVGRFPDAPTVRGRRHLDHLRRLTAAGEPACILFIVQRADARRVVPFHEIDPQFAQALRQARDAGVLLRAAGFRLNASGQAIHVGPLPVSGLPLSG